MLIPFWIECILHSICRMALPRSINHHLSKWVRKSEKILFHQVFCTEYCQTQLDGPVPPAPRVRHVPDGGGGGGGAAAAARGRQAGLGRRRGATESPQRPGLGPEQPAPRPPRPEGPGCAERRRHEPRRERDAELPPPPTSPSSARAAQQSGSRGRARRLRPRPRRLHAAACAFPSSRLGKAPEPTGLIGWGGRCSAAPEQTQGSAASSSTRPLV